ncbi:MAG: helix-turn-helix transcriptional regulator, partial [Clostridiales bacterium]|nr:helix-turn-helix transcriptional regulator [Clostridiales bacterium]
SSYLSRVFKKQTGYNLMFYISKRRIEKAVELINQGNLSLTEISQFVGYDDYTYFYRVFKKVKNKSPSEYRDMQLAKKK